MKKRLIANILAILVLLGMMVPAASATETEDASEESTEATEAAAREFSTAKSGTCGDDLQWELDGHTLTITGSGEMDAGSPWEFYKDTIHTVILDGDITTIGAEAFASCNNLKNVDFGDALVEIGVRAFYSCNELKMVRVPDTFRKFNVECFLDCDGLDAVICDGPMPSFKGSCLYTNHTVVVYFSLETPWPASETDRLVSNFGGRVYVQPVSAEILDEYEKNSANISDEEEEQPQETQAPTEAPVETTQPPVTEPAVQPVVAAAEPETQPVTEPVETSVQTEPETTAPTEEPTEAETEPTEEQTIVEKAGSNGWIWMVIVAAGVTCLLVLALVIRMILHKGGKYSE